MKINTTPNLDLARTQFESASQNRKISSSANPDIKQIRKLSEDFESIFLEIMLKSMRDSVQKSDLIPNSNGEQVFRSMLDSEYASQMSKQSKGGIADAVESFLLSQTNLTPSKKIDLNRGFKEYQKQNLQQDLKQGTINSGAITGHQMKGTK